MRPPDPVVVEVVTVVRVLLVRVNEFPLKNAIPPCVAAVEVVKEVRSIATVIEPLTEV